MSGRSDGVKNFLRRKETDNPKKKKKLLEWMKVKGFKGRKGSSYESLISQDDTKPLKLKRKGFRKYLPFYRRAKKEKLRKKMLRNVVVPDDRQSMDIEGDETKVKSFYSSPRDQDRLGAETKPKSFYSSPRDQDRLGNDTTSHYSSIESNPYEDVQSNQREQGSGYVNLANQVETSNREVSNHAKQTANEQPKGAIQCETIVVQVHHDNTPKFMHINDEADTLKTFKQIQYSIQQFENECTANYRQEADLEMELSNARCKNIEKLFKLREHYLKIQNFTHDRLQKIDEDLKRYGYNM